ncbi:MULTISPECIES: transcription termination factor NusA [Mucilaginibacter]|jgi:N utilization substance protein A|uniref:Transcription termination/antitermination protein NusA n=2 Tax=Mucilaginibacter TaxID=423349 RepID=A0AAE6JKH5_9SPHI|nr:MULTISPECIES: transcription termination factor NusA [Mucilaginibacter]NVM64539.1 N utilization substance protein A [Mucilaginibacter sp. SG538B]QEM06991.1 transcription termination/antitermination protein NusA [Mucilaginibacter rubeus]QEM19579.1 transcription termination/antitermination protein NusA [Mucilaginibacter gossypii]QTE35501.1 transcription termination factor NusA [Mucilaginibacter gossypii]QTE43867.1 transcription termination/antitermination protein NusA [Mucilaginibacter rubeus]
MSNINLIDSFQEFKDFKNIDRPTMMSVLEDVFRSMIRKKYGTDENCDVIVNTDNGDLEIWRTRKVMEDGFSEDDDLEIELAEAHLYDADLEVGDDYIEQITLESFGRRAILAARQTLVSKILELEKDEIFKKYKDRVGEIVTGEVYQVWKKETLVLDDEGNELLLPKTEQIPADYFKKGDSVKAVVSKVDMLNSNPKIIISRTAPEFLQRLFELEVPEIFDGLITIKKIVREPGERAKVAVESYDDRIDPVGACVGMKGSRIHGIVRELKNENIDVINFTNNVQLYIQRALSPAKITSIKLDDEKKTAAVYLKPDQVSLAIGRGGHNIKLAGKLTGYEIDVYREADEHDEDVDIEEFSDEIEGWIIDEFKRIGLDTAKSVLALTVGELVKRTDLEEETVKEVLSILNAEFE